MNDSDIGGVCGFCHCPRTAHAPGCGADTKPRSSQEALETATRKPRQIAVQFTQDEVDKLTANARRWMGGPEGQAELKQYLLETSLVLLQIKKHLALQPPAERSGNQVQSKAIMDFMDLAESMMRVVAAAEKKAEEVDSAS